MRNPVNNGPSYARLRVGLRRPYPHAPLDHARASPSARLVHARGPGAEACGDESDRRRAVASRLGYDPFFPWAKQTVTATISRDGRMLVEFKSDLQVRNGGATYVEPQFYDGRYRLDMGGDHLVPLP